MSLLEQDPGVHDRTAPPRGAESRLTAAPRRLTAALPPGVRCALALTYDLEMCAGYAPDGVNHGRIMPALQAYTLRLCDVAECYGVRLHFFLVCNGLEGGDTGYLAEILSRGHVIDSHTYSHQSLATSSPTALSLELQRANHLLEIKLGVRSTVLRGPFGYSEGWRNLPAANRRVILDNGFRWVSGEFDDRLCARGLSYWVRAPERGRPYVYPEGLVEIPSQGWTDRGWFDLRPQVDQAQVDLWRRAHGHRPVQPGWRASWLADRSLEAWIALNLATMDHVYDLGELWVLTWHPYTHYLHDPECRMLETFLQHAADKPERAWVCTLRDVVEMLPKNA